MLIQAKVLKQTQAGVELATCPQKDCGGCKLCRPRSEKLIIKTRKKFRRGQLVSVQMDTAYFWRALGLLIFLPLVTLTVVLNALLRLGLAEILAAFISLAVCLGEYIAVYFYDRTIKTADLYKIIS